ncbi:hypothetical protein NTGHW29_150033 [Candidatus Nitrotoga sp. HW29]|nr:hypothetical protein NTGHW29_150033 [Candidatus Nitrotoga sp. HW29]
MIGINVGQIECVVNKFIKIQFPVHMQYGLGVICDLIVSGFYLGINEEIIILLKTMY